MTDQVDIISQNKMQSSGHMLIINSIKKELINIDKHKTFIKRNRRLEGQKGENIFSSIDSEVKQQTINKRAYQTIDNCSNKDRENVSRHNRMKSLMKKSPVQFNQVPKIMNNSQNSSRGRYQQLYQDAIDNYFVSHNLGPVVKKIQRFQYEIPSIYTRFIQSDKTNLEFLKRNIVSSDKKDKIYLRYQKTNFTSKTKPKQIKQYIEENIQPKFPDTQNSVSSAKQTKPQQINVKWLLSIRKPINRKQYFVFGLTDRVSIQDKIQKYRDFLWKINFSNSLHVVTPQDIITPYKAFIGFGNNSHLIKGVLRRRFWWSFTDKHEDQNINFLWTQLKVNNYFVKQKNGSIIESKNTKKVIQQKIQSSVGSQLLLEDKMLHQKIFYGEDFNWWIKYLSKNKKVEEKICEKTYIKRLFLYQKKKVKKISSSNKLKMHNHLSQNFFIGNKKALFYNIRQYCKLVQKDPFTIIPLTFHISKGVQDPQYSNFLEFYNKFQEQKVNKSQKNMWIVKPGENTNRGSGITVCYHLDDIKLRLKGREKNKDGKLRTFIIQKYIEKPLLYCKRKFDIRHYMLITCINGQFKAYWYEQGYVRTSSSDYCLKNNKDPLIHLTNDAIQKFGKDYGKFENGNKVSYPQFQKYLTKICKKITKGSIDFEKQILSSMKTMAQEAVRATYKMLDFNRKQHNFQLLGLDYMIDQDFKPWLIQVNTNPCLQTSSPILERIIPNLIENVFRICIDPIFPPPQNWPSNKKVYLGENILAQNKFSIIFDESTDGAAISQLYKNMDYIDKRMGEVNEDEDLFQQDIIEQENEQALKI